MQQKQLPTHPSLEHLKSQAKQLLKAHKGGTLDALQRIRAFFPKLTDATDVEIQNAAFGLQDAHLVIAREYGFASWTLLKEEVLRHEQSAAETSPKDLLFQILRTPDLTQAHIQRVEDLLTTDPSLISVRDENGRTPIEALASRGLINFGKERWYRPIRQLYDLFRAHGAATNIVAAAYGREFILGLLFAVAASHEIDIEKDLASALTQTFALDVTEKLLKTTQPSASVLTNALIFACEVYQPEKVRLLLKNGADPSASVKAKFRYDVVQNLKLGDDGSRTSERSPLFLPGTKTLASETVAHTYEMSPLLVAIGTWYGLREAAEALDECLEIVEALLEAGADVHRSYRVDIDEEVLELTPLTYTQRLASLFPDKPFDRIIEVLLRNR